MNLAWIQSLFKKPEQRQAITKQQMLAFHELAMTSLEQHDKSDLLKDRDGYLAEPITELLRDAWFFSADEADTAAWEILFCAWDYKNCVSRT